ncbi:MAG TPA: hypothetical protein VGU69_12895 [Rhizomicrobium sp.]|nr:hypothetical protein [Rhizomicrobium sp.]
MLCQTFLDFTALSIGQRWMRQGIGRNAVPKIIGELKAPGG